MAQAVWVSAQGCVGVWSGCSVDATAWLSCRQVCRLHKLHRQLPLATVLLLRPQNCVVLLCARDPHFPPHNRNDALFKVYEYGELRMLRWTSRHMGLVRRIIEREVKIYLETIEETGIVEEVFTNV